MIELTLLFFLSVAAVALLWVAIDYHIDSSLVSIQADIKRMERRENNIVRALDATYNLVNAYARGEKFNPPPLHIEEEDFKEADKEKKAKK